MLAESNKSTLGSEVKRKFKMTLEQIFENLVNGNLSDAKRGAANYSGQELAEFAEQQLGWSTEKSLAAALYMLGETSFQSFCDMKDN